MRRKRTHLLAGLLAVLALTACSNTGQQNPLFSLGKTLIDARRSPQSNAGQKVDERIVQREIQRALSSTDGPLTVMRIEGTGSVAVLRVIETNGPYSTWAAWGTSERRSISTRGGVITSTRGLGSDLMSSSIDSLLGMVSRRENGVQRQVLRHLDGENKIEEMPADCDVTPKSSENYAAGALRLPVTRVDVYCKAEDAAFSNSYLVSPGGRIVESRTWLGEGLGYFKLSHLR